MVVNYVTMALSHHGFEGTMVSDVRGQRDFVIQCYQTNIAEINTFFFCNPVSVALPGMIILPE